MGAAKAVLVSDDALKGSDALDTAKVLAKAIERAGGADLVLTATESSDGYTGTVPEQIAALLGLPSVTFAKSVTIDGGTVKVQRQTEAGYDEVECPAARRGVGDRRCGRAPLPLVQGDHGGQVQAGRPGRRSPTSASTPASVGWAGAGQEIVDVVEAAPAREAGEIIEDDGEAHRQDRRVPRRASRSSDHPTIGDEDMALSKIWVFAEAPDGNVATITLEMLAKARELADTVEAVTGGDGAAVAADARRPRRHQGATPPATSAARCRACPWPRPSPRPSRAATRPDAHPVRHHLRRPRRRRPPLGEARRAGHHQHRRPGRASTAASWCPSRSSVARRIVKTKFTAGGPGIALIRPKSFAAEESGGGAAEVAALAVPDTARPVRPRSSTATSRRPPVPSSTRPPSSSPVAVASARADKYQLIEDLAKAAQGARRAPPGPSSTPAGCPTATRWARPARS